MVEYKWYNLENAGNKATKDENIRRIRYELYA